MTRTLCGFTAAQLSSASALAGAPPAAAAIAAKTPTTVTVRSDRPGL